MLNVIQTGDTLAIVCFWQVSNLPDMPYCVLAEHEARLIAFDSEYMLCCLAKLLFILENWLDFIIKQQLIKLRKCVNRGETQVEGRKAK